MPMLCAACTDACEPIRVACMDFLSTGVTVENACSVLENDVRPRLPNALMQCGDNVCSVQAVDPKENSAFGYIEQNMWMIVNTPGFLKLSERNVLSLVQSQKLAISEVRPWSIPL